MIRSEKGMGESASLPGPGSAEPVSQRSGMAGREAKDVSTSRHGEELRRQILDLTRRYYREVLADRGHFQPGVTQVGYAGRVFDEHEMSNLVSSCLEFWLTWGRYSREFEARLAEILGVRWALLVNSGSSANLLAFSALCSPLLGDRRVRPGDEVITTAASFPTTVAPIVQNGCVPVFVDVDPATANIDAGRMDAACGERTRAVMLAHTLGNPFDLDAVVSFCRAHDLWLIEDNCDSLGSLYGGKPTGSFGHIGTSSFYPPHHLTTGEGGAVYTSDPLLKKILASLRDWGRDCYCDSGVDNTCARRFSGQHGTLPAGYDHKYVYSHLGYNLKATDMQAAIGVAQLDKLDGFTRARRRNHELLARSLEPLSHVLQLQRAQEGSEPSWFGCLMTVAPGAAFTRNELTSHLESRRIQTRTLFAGNIVRQPAFRSLREGEDYRVVGDLVHTDALMERAFWIGVYPGMDRARLEYMVDEIRAFVDGRGQT